MIRSYSDLAKAAKRGEVRPIIGLGGGFKLGVGRWIGQITVGDPEKPSLDFNRPNYDFGHLFDRIHPDWIGDEAYSYHLDEGYSRMTKGDWFPPQETCAYFFRCTKDTLDYDRVYCVLLQRTGLSIEGTVFIRQEAPHEPFRSWMMDAASFSLGSDGTATYSYGIPRPIVSDDAIEALKDRTTRTVEDVIVATTLLIFPKAVEVRSGRNFSLDKYNRDRKLGQPRLNAPSIIHLDRSLVLTELAKNAGPQQSSTSMIPHERRAHIRIIWRGTEKEREVKVKAASINGGNPIQPYRIKS